MAAPVLRFKRGNFSALPGLQAGEPGWVVDEFDLFVGIDSTTNNNKIVGSARYWERETATSGSAVRLVEGANNGDHYVALKSPAALTSSQDYILPAAAVAGGYMKVDGSGNMSWSTEVDITTPLSVLNIDGGTDIGADITDADLFIVDDGGGGTNRKTAASRIKTYVLGGGSGASFAAISVSGIGTVTFADTTTLKVAAGATVTGALDVDGGANVAGGLTVTGSQTVDKLTVTGSQTVDQLTVSGVTTATTFDGALATTNLTGTITNAQLAGSIANNKLANSTVSYGGITLALGASDATPAFDLADATNYPTSSLVGTITNAQLAGSIADTKLNQITSANKVDVSAIDIDGATDIGANLVDADLLVVDDGAGGTNRKTAMSRVKDYVLGGGAGANFVNLQATGITTTVQLQSVDINVSAGATVTGALDVDGGANIASGLTVTGGLTANSAIISDLTDNRVLIAGSGGEVEDSANLTFDGSDLGVTGDVTASGTVQGAQITATSAATLASAAVQDLTSGRVVLAGSGGELGDDSGLTYGNNDLRVTGGINATGVATATQFATGASGSAIIVTSDTITGPSSITLDPAALNDNSGTVFILGDLQVKGTTTQVDSTTVSVADLAIEVAKGAANDAAANGAGFTVDSGEGDKTFHFEALGDNFGSSENLNLASGKVLKVNNTEILSATALSSSIVVDAASVNIDGATAIGADLVDADLFLVDDGAGGTNRKITATEIKDYMLGGGAGANFAAINVSGISTVAFADATTLKVGAGATITGALDVDGGAILNSAAVSDLTDGRVVLAGSGGELEDSGNLTFDGSTLAVTGAATVSTDLTVTEELTARDASLRNVVSSGVITATDVRNAAGGLLSLVGVSSASGDAGIVTAFKFRGQGLENFIVQDGVADVVLTGVASTTFTTTEVKTATEGQTTFSFSAGYQAGFLDLYLNGVRLVTGADYSAQNGSTAVLTNGAKAGDELEMVGWKSLGNVVELTSLTTVTDLTVGGIATATTFDGALATTNLTGTVTNAQLANNSVSFGGVEVDLGAADATPAFDLQDATNLPTTSLTGTITNAQLAGSIADSKLNTLSTANKVALSALDIDGATATTSIVDADLLVVDDGANGTNRKVTATNLKDYMLGGGAGANFAAINVSGISTNTFLKSTTATVGAGLTVTGIIDGNGGMNISGAESTMSSATVSDLTNGRIVTAGTGGALEDDANLTWDGSTLGVGGVINGSNGASITGAETVLSSATVSDLTSGRVVLAGSSGAVEDSGNLTFNGSTLAVNGSITATSNLTVTGDLVVNGNTTQINTVNTTIEDTLLELQKVDGGALSADTNKDVGLVMNYFSGSAKKAAFFWDDSVARFALASVATESNGVMTPSTYGGLEIGSLYVNDCAGASQVISCSGTTRSLENISIDGGSF